MYTTPPTQPSESTPAPNKAWIALDDSGTGSVKAVGGISNLDTASVSTVGILGRVYHALAPAPQGNERVYAAHAGGVDAIRHGLGQPTNQNGWYIR
jgi:hypothetical protein